MILLIAFLLLQVLFVAASPSTTSVIIEGPITTAPNGDVQVALPPETALPRKEGTVKTPFKDLDKLSCTHHLQNFRYRWASRVSCAPSPDHGAVT